MATERVPGEFFGKPALLFFAIPLLAAALLGNYSSHRFEEHFERQTFAKMDKRLDRIITQSSRRDFIIQSVNRLSELVLTEGPESKNVEEMWRKITTEDELDLTAYLLRDKKIVKCLPENSPHQETVEGIFSSFPLTREAFAEQQKKLHRGITELLGTGARLELVKRFRGVYGPLSKPLDGTYFCQDLTPHLGVFFLIMEHSGHFSRFKKMDQTDQKFAGMASVNEDHWLPPTGISIDRMKTAWYTALRENRRHTTYDNRHWVFAWNDTGLVYCCSQPTGETPFGLWLRRVVIVGFVLSGAILALAVLAHFRFSLGLAATSFLESLPIRFKLFGVFAALTLLPLCLAIILGSLSLLDRHEALVNEAETAGVEGIHQLAQSYSAGAEAFRKLALELRNSAPVQQVNTGLLASTVYSLVEEDLLQRFELRAADGTLFFANTDPAVHGSNWAMDLMSRIAIRRHAPARLGKTVEKVSAEELMTESLISSFDNAMVAPLRLPGRLWRFEVGTSPALFFWDVFPEMATGPAFISIIHQAAWIMARQMKESLRTGRLGDDPMHAMLQSNRQDGTLEIFPAVSGPDKDALIAAAVRCQGTSQTLFREFDLEGGRYWVTIQAHSHPSSFVFLQIVPVSGKLQTLHPIIQGYAVTFLGALLAAVLSATLLSRFFLIPIADLTVGIKAIQRRDDTHRIPLQRQDEFGAVITAFNRLISEFKELQYGRIIQESLLPGDPPIPPGYEVSVLRHSATDLAGDYHDIFRLPDGDWVFIIGDVTGHGISAALAVAMAKATVEYQSLSGWSFPKEVLERLNALFFRELKPRNKYMTLGCLKLNPNTHEVLFENAGHPFPLIYFHNRSTVDEIAAPQMPLGMKNSRKGVPHLRVLEPGDAILLYTDGFIECQNPQGKDFGIDGLTALFAQLIGTPRPLPEILLEMDRILDEFRVPGPYGDDVTLVLIRRQFAPAEKASPESLENT